MMTSNIFEVEHLDIYLFLDAKTCQLAEVVEFCETTGGTSTVCYAMAAMLA